MPSDDEIMARHLLEGARMLARSCPDCGCPLFEVRGETGCVVCAARKEAAPTPAPRDAPSSVPAGTPAQAPAGPLGEELAATIVSLLRRARAEPDPERCRALMESVRIGWDLLG